MKKVKNILISAYACEPHKGSEPGIGWHWVIELARLEYNVHVITRSNNKEVIEAELNTLEPLKNLSFHYYDLSRFYRNAKKKIPFGVYFYYFFWQFGIVNLAKNIVNNHNIDVVHHITFGVFRQPSFLYKLKKPFVFGPVGGAETTPNRLLASLGKKEYATELFRNFVNRLFKYSPILNRMYKKTDLILCKTPETSAFLSKRFDNKKKVRVEIGVENTNANQEIKVNNNEALKILYVGRFIGWKGVYLGVDAVKKAMDNDPEISFTMIGKGYAKEKLLKQSKGYNINFLDWVKQEELFNYYSSYDCFLFPSFHDSSGTVILEAFSFGLPVICLNLGGPKELVNEKCGFVIDVEGKSSDQISTDISNTILRLNKDKKLLLDLKKGAKKEVTQYTWANAVKTIYNDINSDLFCKN